MSDIRELLAALSGNSPQPDRDDDETPDPIHTVLVRKDIVETVLELVDISEAFNQSPNQGDRYRSGFLGLDYWAVLMGAHPELRYKFTTLSLNDPAGLALDVVSHSDIILPKASFLIKPEDMPGLRLLALDPLIGPRVRKYRMQEAVTALTGFGAEFVPQLFGEMFIAHPNPEVSAEFKVALKASYEARNSLN